jgi:hypothetical protein
MDKKCYDREEAAFELYFGVMITASRPAFLGRERYLYAPSDSEE